MKKALDQIFRTNNVESAKQLIIDSEDFSGELYWSLLFWKLPDFLFICINNSTKISKEVLSNSLSEKLLQDMDKTFHSITILLEKLNELLLINIIEPKELTFLNNSTFPDEKNVIILYSIILSTLFPFLTNNSMKNKETELEFSRILHKTKLIINKYVTLSKDSDRLFQKIYLLNDFSKNFLSGVLNGIIDRIGQVPIVQHIAFN